MKISPFLHFSHPTSHTPLILTVPHYLLQLLPPSIPPSHTPLLPPSLPPTPPHSIAPSLTQVKARGARVYIITDNPKLALGIDSDPLIIPSNKSMIKLVELCGPQKRQLHFMR